MPRSAEYRSREIRGYGEYGLVDWFTLYGSLTYKWLAVEEQTVRRETYGLGDLYLGGRYALVRGAVRVSLSSEIKLPTGYSTEDYPALGAGQVDLAFRGLMGGSTGPVYATADLGWMFREGDFQNQIVGSVELGGQAFGRYGGRLVLRWAQSVGEAPVDASADAPSFDPALASPRMVMLDGTLGVGVVRGFVLEASVSHMLSGRNALAGNTFELALVYSGRIRRGR